MAHQSWALTTQYTVYCKWPIIALSLHAHTLRLGRWQTTAFVLLQEDAERKRRGT